MILLWGLPGDSPMAQVRDALIRMGCAPTFFDQRATLGACAEMSVGPHLSATVTTDEGVVDLRDVSAMYLRPYDAQDLPPVQQAGPDSETYCNAVQLQDLLYSWVELTSALVVNRPSAMAHNCSKPFQARQLRDLGFNVPDTLIATDPTAVVEFRERHRRVIYKSISGVRSIVSELTDEHLPRLDNLRWCPTQFQELIVGTDYRVHVVGEETFAAEIRSEATDYRYAGRQGHDVSIESAGIPDEVAQRCIAASRAMGLAVSGVDLRRTPDDKWYCFEVNPSPAFDFYQNQTGHRIDEAIAGLLIDGPDSAGAADSLSAVTPGGQTH
jgi:RimK-like ATP-grasp domain